MTRLAYSIGRVHLTWTCMIALAAPAASFSHGATDGNATNAAPRVAMAPAPLTYDSFRLITDRNIFNGNRSGQRVRSTRSSSQQRSTRVDSFTLVGTLVTDTSATAFFDGSESSFRKALKPGLRISSFELASVQPAGVRLTEGTNVIDLKVGAGFRREERGPWKSTGSATKYVGDSSATHAPEPTLAIASTDAPAAEEPPADEPAATSAAPAAEDSGVEMNDVLKKLIEKRAKE